MISVVIPTCHRAEVLARCLERLAPGRQEKMRHGEDYEVIVSDAGTRERAEPRLRARCPWVRWKDAAGCGPGPNRNAGAKHARGDWLAFTDDDCLPEPCWLARLAARVAQGDVDVIEGAILSPTLPDHPLWTAPVNTTGNAGWTANLCVRRTLFERLGGFDPDLVETAEDMEFHFRSRRAGARWVFVREAAVEHPPRRLTWPQFWRETLRFRWWFMYRLKVGWGPGPEAGRVRSLVDVVGALAKIHARTTWNLLRDLGRGKTEHIRRDLFMRARDWILFPVLVPYFWRWAVAYRRQLRTRNA